MLVEIKFCTAKASSHESLRRHFIKIFWGQELVLNNRLGVAKHVSWIGQLTIGNRKYFGLLKGSFQNRIIRV